MVYLAPSHYLTNEGSLSFGPLEINFSEILIKKNKLSFYLKKMFVKMISSAEWRLLCLEEDEFKRVHAI